MKKVGIYLGSDPHAGGVFQYNQTILDVLRALPRNEFEMIVVYTNPKWGKYVAQDTTAFYIERSFFDKLIFKFWTTLCLPVACWRRFAPLVHPFVRTLIRYECDFWVFPSQDMWSYMVPVPALVTIHDLMHRYERRFPESGGFFEYYAREWNYSNICRWSKLILVDSAVGAGHVQESYGAGLNRIRILPYIPPQYIYSKETSLSFDQKYRLPQKFIFYPAQFWEHKNHKALVRAAHQLKNRGVDLRLVFVGSKKNGYAALLKLIKRLGMEDHFIFLGYEPDEDMPEFYRRSRALVMPTFFGPTNIPPLEAMALGCPVAASRIYAMPEQMGDAALWFDPSSDEEIAAALEELWTDDGLCQRLSKEGLERSRKWGWSQFEQRLQRIIREL